ncbi:MAG TPA: flagellar export chaperone FliS [Candidatus Acidoferrales bacterium]|jgi:flagellar protein FliS|nr:flagellar export chaperone FliS [Candidatus Acidoferrales bacterium]
MPYEKNAASTYQQCAARGATPAAITGMIYDVAIESLHRAIRAIDENKIPERIAASNKLFAAIAELRSSLDYERGGEVARRLGRFYQMARGEVLEANMRVNRAVFEKYSHLFAELREAWRKVESETAGAGAAAESGPIRTVKAPPAELEFAGSSWSA